MTQEQKAKAYDGALKRAKFYHGNCPSEPERRKLEKMFPVLRESKNDRIRKSLIKFLTDIKEISESGRTTWAVRKEDAEMCKSFLAYLERQKDIEDRWVEDRGQCFWDGVEEGKMLAEKQKEQNGEDEFLEDELSAFLQNYDKEYDDDAAVSDVARHFYEIGKKQKEHKPQTDDEKEYVRTIKSIISDFIRDKKPENLAYYQRIYDWLDGRHVPFSCSHENGKPADPVFSKQEYESHPIISTDTTSTKPVEFDGKTLLYTADKSYQIGFRDGVASVKPAEWSESDKSVLMDAICATDKLGNNEVYNKNNPNLAKAFRAAKDWLKNLPERFNLQPKQEWSEEDEKDVAHIIRILDDCYAYGKHDLSKTDHENLVGTLKSLRLQPKLEWSEEDEHRRDGIIQWLREYQAKFNPKYDSLSIESIESLIDWLKSIRPSWRPSEQEKGALRTAIHVLTEERNFPKAASQLQNILDAFNSKESRKDWKPSEEQMAMLLAVINDPNNAGAESCYMALKSIYNNLKKLM